MTLGETTNDTDLDLIREQVRGNRRRRIGFRIAVTALVLSGIGVAAGVVSLTGGPGSPTSTPATTAELSSARATLEPSIARADNVAQEAEAILGPDTGAALARVADRCRNLASKSEIVADLVACDTELLTAAARLQVIVDVARAAPRDESSAP